MHFWFIEPKKSKKHWGEEKNKKKEMGARIQQKNVLDRRGATIKTLHPNKNVYYLPTKHYLPEKQFYMTL